MKKIKVKGLYWGKNKHSLYFKDIFKLKNKFKNKFKNKSIKHK